MDIEEVFVSSADFTEEEFKAKLAALNDLPIVEFKGDMLIFPRSHRVWAGLYDEDGDYRHYEGLLINGKFLVA